MSSEMVESIHVRLREEIDSCGLSLAAASRAADEASPQRLKDVVSGRQKCSADLLAKLMVVGVDVLYVLSGVRAKARPAELASDEEILLEGYRALEKSKRKQLLAALLVGSVPEGPGQAAQSTNTQTVSGAGHRVAGRDFYTKE
ncbi:hypothetical protein [Pseudomonas protegens]|uniref:hypothetical protein n=1 Tax=Pseudomonas protegens TaxID=380021 RepID=UPI0039065AB3